MPSGDRTGPLGKGQKTGRALGYCTGNNEPGFRRDGLGRGLGRGQGLGPRGINREPLPPREAGEPNHSDIYELLEDIRTRLARLENQE